MNDTDNTLPMASPPISSAHGIHPQDTLIQRGAFDAPTVSRGTPKSTPELDLTVTSPAGVPDCCRPLPQIDGYEVIEEIGRGGMGAVYRARQLAAGGRVVALKVMLGEAFASPAELRRFEREVEIAADLNHANIAHIYDSGLVQGRHYFAMEYVKGQALDAFCKTHDLPVKGRLRLFAAVCEAVAFAHRRGVIHRDLKPSNILVDEEGVPHVLDFGIAKVQSAAGEAATCQPELTMDGMLLGTLPYMAPEQADGKVSAIDTRTDVYALGVILYELLTGKYPYETTGQMADVLRRIAEAEPRKPSTVNRLIGDEVETIILRALHKIPDRRYSGADDFARDVTHFLAGDPIEAKRDSGLYVLRKTMRRYRVPLAFAASIVVMIAASAVISFGLYRRAEIERDLAEASRRQESAAKVQAEAAQREAERQRAIAQSSEKEASRRLARLHFNEGVNRWFERQDAASASAFFVEALRVSPDPFPAARLALHNALQDCPKMRLPPFDHGGYFVDKAAFSPDGKWVVTASRDKTARVWDAATGQPVSIPVQPGEMVRTVALSPDGKRFVTASDAPKTVRLHDDPAARVTAADDQPAQVWDTATGQPVSAPMRHGGSVYAAAFSLDGRWVVTASEDKTARVWNAATGQPVSAPMEHGAGVLKATFSPDGKRVITASMDKTARVWDAATGQPVSAPMQHGAYVSAAAFSPDEKWVITGSGDKTARVWDATTGQPVSAPMEHDAGVSTAAFSPDGKWVLTGSKNTVWVWDAGSGKPISAPMYVGAVWAELANSSSLRASAFSPDGKWVITASADKTARVWDAATGNLACAPMQHHAAVTAASFSPDGGWILSASRGGAVRVWAVPTRLRGAASVQFGAGVYVASFSPDGKWVLTASVDKTARVWDAATGSPVSAPMQHSAGFFAASFSPDGKRVLTQSFNNHPLTGVIEQGDDTIRVWDAATGRPVSNPMPHSVGSWAVFSPDGKRILTGSENSVCVWDAATDRPVSAPMPHCSGNRNASFSQDGKFVLTWSENAARVWDGTTGLPVSAPMKHDAKVNLALFSPDGKRVFTASKDKVARVWDAATGQPASAPMQHHAAVDHAVFSSDGKRVLTTAWDMATKLRDGIQVVTNYGDQTVRLWDAQTGQPITASLAGLYAGFSPDGKFVFVVSILGSAQLWDKETGQQVSAPFLTKDGNSLSAFHPDGRRILTVSDDNVARIWDVETGQPVSAPMHEGFKVTTTTAREHKRGFRPAFSPDGLWVVTSSGDDTARVWDAATGQPVSAPILFGSLVRKSKFSPDWRSIVTLSDDGVARLWRFADADLEEPVGLVQARVQARLGLAVDSSGNVQCLSAEALAAAWKDYERLEKEYEETRIIAVSAGRGQPAGTAGPTVGCRGEGCRL